MNVDRSGYDFCSTLADARDGSQIISILGAVSAGIDTILGDKENAAVNGGIALGATQTQYQFASSYRAVC